MLNVLQQALDDAVRQGLLVRNVAALVQRPARPAHRDGNVDCGRGPPVRPAAADERIFTSPGC